MAEIKYTSFAMPPYGIKLDKTYLFGKDSKGYFYSDAKEKNYLDLAYDEGIRHRLWVQGANPRIRWRRCTYTNSSIKGGKLWLHQIMDIIVAMEFRIVELL